MKIERNFEVEPETVGLKLVKAQDGTAVRRVHGLPKVGVLGELRGIPGVKTRRPGISVSRQVDYPKIK